MKKSGLIICGAALVLLAACAPKGEDGKIVSVEVDEKSIDQYVAEKLDTSQTYDILPGMRFSRGENYAYTAVRFSQQDTAILYTEKIEEASGITYRNIFYKEGKPIFVEEYITIADTMTAVYIERKAYLNGAIVLKAYEKKSEIEDELANLPFKEITMTMSQFDFERAEKAVTQSDEYEMRFGEFLNIDLTMSYLILENEESGFNVALLIMQPDELINYLWADQAGNKGKIIRPYHQMMQLGGMEQMVYMGGDLIE